MIGLITKRETPVKTRPDVRAFSTVSEYLNFPGTKYFDALVVDTREVAQCLIRDVIFSVYKLDYHYPIIFLVRNCGANMALIGTDNIVTEGEESDLNSVLDAAVEAMEIKPALESIAAALILNRTIER